jgi:hypothetical protein
LEESVHHRRIDFDQRSDLIAGFDYRQRQNFAGVWPLQILINDQGHRKEQNGGGADQLFNGVAMHHFSLPSLEAPFHAPAPV